MKKKTVFIAGVIMSVLIFGHCAQGGASVVANGSFEDDYAAVSPITEENLPLRWEDVDLLLGKFGGEVNTDYDYATGWPAHGDYSLILYSRALEKYNAEEMAMVSQQVYLTGVNRIVFNLRLTSSYLSWDPEQRSAVVLIDGSEVWNSYDWAPDVNDEYRNQEIDISGLEGVYDGKLHLLSLAIKSNVDELSLPSYVEYRTHWDFVKFDTHCGGFGYLAEDLDWNCYVDMDDLKVLAEQWLVEKPSGIYDLFEDQEDIINLSDYAIFANAYGALDNTDWVNWGDDNCYDLGVLANDFNNDGIVNFYDYSILVEDWGVVIDYEAVSILADEWLAVNWVYWWLQGLE